MISLFSALSVRKALDDLPLDQFDVEVTFDPTSVLVSRIAAGARPDVLIAMTESFPALEASIDLSSRVPLARTGVGVAVARGQDAPDISTVEALRTALTEARSVAYSRTGASGIYFAKLIEDLGIAAEVNARATVIEKGFTAHAVIDGRADLAVQQMSELKFVPEAQVVGPFPETVQHYSELSIALGVNAGSEPQALLRFLTGPEARTAYAGAGLL
jgi:molybdate transport system substrate-binding protein